MCGVFETATNALALGQNGFKKTNLGGEHGVFSPTTATQTGQHKYLHERRSEVLPPIRRYPFHRAVAVTAERTISVQATSRAKPWRGHCQRKCTGR